MWVFVIVVYGRMSNFYQHEQIVSTLRMQTHWSTTDSYSPVLIASYPVAYTTATCDFVFGPLLLVHEHVITLHWTIVRYYEVLHCFYLVHEHVITLHWTIVRYYEGIALLLFGSWTRDHIALNNCEALWGIALLLIHAHLITLHRTIERYCEVLNNCEVLWSIAQ